MIVSMDGRVFLHGNLPKYLHSDDPVDEEDEDDEDGDPGKGLEGLDEGPEEGADALALGQQLDEPHHAEQPEEVDGDHAVSGLQEKQGERGKSKIILCMRIRPRPYNRGFHVVQCHVTKGH